MLPLSNILKKQMVNNISPQDFSFGKGSDFLGNLRTSAVVDVAHESRAAKHYFHEKKSDKEPESSKYS